MKILIMFCMSSKNHDSKYVELSKFHTYEKTEVMKVHYI